MRLRYLIIITLMTGLISMAGNCLSGQWSAARRPKSSTGGSAGTASTSISKTGADFASPTRSSRRQPLSLLRRPRGRSKAKIPAAAPTETTRVTPVKPAIIQPAVKKEPPSPAPPEPPAKAVSKPVPDKPKVSDSGDIPAAPAPPPQKAAASYGKVPPYFIRNDGQLDQAVRYYVKGQIGRAHV